MSKAYYGIRSILAALGALFAAGVSFVLTAGRDLAVAEYERQRLSGPPERAAADFAPNHRVAPPPSEFRAQALRSGFGRSPLPAGA